MYFYTKYSLLSTSHRLLYGVRKFNFKTLSLNSGLCLHMLQNKNQTLLVALYMKHFNRHWKGQLVLIPIFQENTV